MGNLEFLCVMLMKLHPTDTYFLEETKPDKGLTFGLVPELVILRI